MCETCEKIYESLRKTGAPGVAIVEKDDAIHIYPFHAKEEKK